VIPSKYKYLASGKNGHAAIRGASRFVADLWDGYDAGVWTFIGTRDGGRWRDHPIKGSDRRAQVVKVLDTYSPDRHDAYFCPNAFSESSRRAEFALPSRYAHCDIDAADPAGYDPQPNILWETSPGRFQGIWMWREAAIGKVAEQFSRNIVYKQGGDQGGWSITKMLRLPGTINHKPDYDRPLVRLRAYDERPQLRPAFPSVIEAPEVIRGTTPGLASSADAATIMRRYRRHMGLLAGTLMTARKMLRKDRSGAVFQIVAGLISAGALDTEIATVLVGNPYFIDKWGTDRARAEQEVGNIRSRLEGRR
jgi:hypothetical protein